MVNHTSKLMKSLKKAMDNGLLKADEVQCARCEWAWIPRKEEPKSCPHCKSYDWKGKKSK